MLQPIESPVVRAHGPAIREFRKRSNLTIEQVATHVGISKVFLSRIERNKRGAKRDTLQLLAEALGVPFDAITYPESR